MLRSAGLQAGRQAGSTDTERFRQHLRRRGSSKWHGVYRSMISQSEGQLVLKQRSNTIYSSFLCIIRKSVIKGVSFFFS